MGLHPASDEHAFAPLADAIAPPDSSLPAAGLQPVLLRKLAAVKGLVNNELRSRLWPRLLGGAAAADDTGLAVQQLPEGYAAAAEATHRDSSTVRCDVERSLWAFTGGRGRQRQDEAGSRAVVSCCGHRPGSLAARLLHAAHLTDELPTADGWSDAERDARRQELQRMLNAVVVTSAGGVAGQLAGCSRHCRPAVVELGRTPGCLTAPGVLPAGSVHYYQGLHDVAGVLLLVSGEAKAFQLLQALAQGHLRDATRPTLDAVLELLALLAPITEAVDQQLAAHIAAQGLPPFFALSWYITWFAHDVPDLASAARLFDLFLASHPLMPLYVGAVAMRSQRATLLECEEMPELHSALMNMHITKNLTVDDLACQVGLQPSTLTRRLSCTVATCIGA
jgi:hypothetical protein